MPVTISKLKKLLKKGDEVERCGVILNDDSIIEVDNSHDTPTKGFRINASVLMEYEDRMVATWHTHPQDTANLSQEDDAGFKQWPMLHHYIVGVDGVRCFEVADNFIIEVAQ